jgi:hypothetical protein
MDMKNILSKLSQLNEGAAKNESILDEPSTKETPTGRVHTAKPGGYGRKDDEDDEGKKVKSSAAPRGRGRPKKGADSTTGEVMKPDWSAFGGPKPGSKSKDAKLPKWDKSKTTKHSLKEYFNSLDKAMNEGGLAVQPIPAPKQTGQNFMIKDPSNPQAAAITTTDPAVVNAAKQGTLTMQKPGAAPTSSMAKPVTGAGSQVGAMAEDDEKWIQGAIKKPGAFTAKAKSHGITPAQFRAKVLANKKDYPAKTEKQAQLAKTLSKLQEVDAPQYFAQSSPMSTGGRNPNRLEEGNLRITEGKVKELSMDLKELTDEQFKKKYKMTKAEMRTSMKQKGEKQGVAEAAPMSSQQRASDRDEQWAMQQGAKNNGIRTSQQRGYTRTSQERASDRDEQWAKQQGVAEAAPMSSQQRASDRDEQWAMQQGAKNNGIRTSQQRGYTRTSQERASDRDEQWAKQQGVAEGETTQTSTGRVHKGTYGTSYDDDYTAPPTQRGRGRPKKGADSTTGEVMKPDWSAFSKKVTPKTKLPTTRHKMVSEEGAKPDFLDLDKDGNKTEPMKKAAKKKVKEGMEHKLQAARLEGKSHALRKMAYNCSHDDMEEARHYHDGFKEGLDECYGQMPSMGHTSTDSLSPEAGAMASYGARDMDEGNAFTAGLASTPRGSAFSLGGNKFTDRSN